MHSEASSGTERYLLFDSGCSICRGVATEIEHASDRKITVRSLREPYIQSLLRQTEPNWRWEPTLLELKGNQLQVYTGFSMRVRMVSILGLRRAWQVARFVSKATLPTSTPQGSRRRFLKHSAMAAVGLALFGFRSSSTKAGDGSSQEPGEPAKQKGVESYVVEKLGPKTRVHFSHSDPSKSGIIAVQQEDPSEAQVELIRNNTSLLELRIDSTALEIFFRDGAGQEANLMVIDSSWKRNDPANVVDNNANDISLMAAIYHDFEKLPEQSVFDPSPRTNSGAEPMADCPCGLWWEVTGESGLRSRRSLACQEATEDANVRCTNEWCWGCCRLLTCDCVCVIDDLICSCARTGYGCTGSCA